jgi:hypothetical protein
MEELLELADISLWSLMAAFIFGVIGFYLFREGRRRPNFAWITIGLALMVYPIFVSNAWLNWGIGAMLCTMAYYYL